MHCVSAALAGVLALTALDAWAQSPPMGVADMIETARLQTGASADVVIDGRRYRTGEGFSISPRGTRFVSARVRGDIANDLVRVDIMTSRLADLEAASQVSVAAELTARVRGDTDILVSFSNMFSWLSEDIVALRWEAEDGSIQVFAVDLANGESRKLTHQSGGVAFFRAHESGAIIYQSPPPPETSPGAVQTGGLVQSIDGYALAQGQTHRAGLLTATFNRHWYLARPGQTAQRIDISGMGHDVDRTRGAAFSPDGRYVVVAATPSQIPASWDAYRGGYIDAAVVDERASPRTGILALQLQQLYIIEVATGRTRVALPAPAPFAFDFVFWSPDSRSFAVGPISLPTPTDEAGLTGAALVEIDARTLTRRRVPTAGLSAPRRTWDSVQWADARTLLVREGETTLAARRSGGAWRAFSPEAAQALAQSLSQSRDAPIELELRQSANDPPVLFAIDRSAEEERAILDPNPNLGSRFSLGHVEHITWQGGGERTWSGMLYYPVGYVEGRQYPLVIQTHGHAAPNQFSLNGMGGMHPATGPSVSIYVAQPLAGRGMFVLQMEDQGGFSGGPEELPAYMDAYAGAINALDARGFIDRHRVGVSGFSRTGWHVLHALTRTDLEFAAALVSDNIHGGYSHNMIVPGALTYEVGVEPFGADLENWLEQSPSFAVERLRTPLRVQVEGASSPVNLLSAWEFFSRARRLNLPVEYNLAPDVLNGSHQLQNPTQILAVQQGAVDWFDYWLNGVEPSGDNGARRRQELNALRNLRDAANASARPPLLDWSATPRP